MNAESLDILQRGDEEAVCSVLDEFNRKHAKSFAFPDQTPEVKQKLLAAVMRWLESKASSKTYSSCLQTVRIISRDKSGLDTLMTTDLLATLVQHSGLGSYSKGEVITKQEGDPSVMLEAQKCLCNIIFNSPAAQRVCSGNGCVEGIIQRLKTYKDPALRHEVKFFDMRLLFLLTALCADIRPKLRNDLHGFTYLIEVLDLTLRSVADEDKSMSDQEVELCSEILKILFNLTVTIDRDNMDEEEEAHFLRLVSVLHELLVCDVASKDKREELHSHTVNLLTNMPRESYEELLTPLNEGAVGGAENKDVEYDGKNMEAIVTLMDFLDKRLDVPKQSMKEGLAPILHCLCEICRANRSIRKFCRMKVLPYLGGDDVMRLPEEGPTIRNKVCKLFTCLVPEVKDLAADFLFVLCKESVARFVKYTGYGNAAGLLAQRGLLCGGCGADYSSESDESETEEYSQLRDSINPITGRWELERPDPMAEMSDEQKEYEAMKLVNKLDKLQRAGIVQPSRVGEDGKPHPVEHILELVEGSGPAEPPGATGNPDTD
ncbi:hypothetical protein NP493_722g02070 [Ridgeia piscesae]|uniref:Synembryn-A n=2 Tax=Ridgeia piscesae TaxID=27915 RepID=A0AAD9NQ53_RIDPI|nr:hypothetical protein NP493_722g02070 [Ridgeia piscesae]